MTPPFETSKPAGAVTVTPLVRFAPLTVNVCGADAVPTVVVKPLIDIGLTVKDGGGALTAPKTESAAEVAPVLATVILSLIKEATDAPAAMRISMDVAVTVPLSGVMVVEDP